MDRTFQASRARRAPRARTRIRWLLTFAAPAAVCVELLGLVAPGVASAKAPPSAGAAPVLSTLAPAGPLAHAAACMPSPLTVTNYTDSARTPGTLRYLVAHACAGATIGFASHTRVPLTNVLTLARPVTLRGGVLAGGKLLVQSSDVSLTGMNLSDTPVLIGPADGPTAKHLENVSIVGSMLAVNDKSLQNAVQADATDNLTLGSKSAPDTFQTLTKVAVNLDLDGPVSVVGDKFDTGPGSQHNIAISEEGSSNLTVEYNSSDGDIFTEPAQGHIEYNTIDEAAAAASSPPPTPLSKIFHSGLGLLVAGTAYTAGGRVVVKGNVVTNAGIEVQRENVEIAQNKLTGGATGMLVTCGSNDIENSGPIQVVGNTLNQTIPGLRYVCTNRTPSATIQGNTLTNNDARGVELTTKVASVNDNNVSGSGSKGSPNNQPAPGIQIDAPGGTGVALSGNHTNSDTGDGIDVGAKAVAVISGGESYNNTLAGVYVAPGSRASITKGSFMHNTGPGIDLDPRGVTPNDQAKNGNSSINWPATNWNQPLSRIQGTTCPSCLVQGYTREAAPWTGNPDNGEGASFVASVVADSSGNFTWPTPVTSCAAALNYTFTATQPGASAGPLGSKLVQITSEFSSPPTCPTGTCPSGATTCCPTGSTSCCPDGTGTGCCQAGQTCCTTGQTGCCSGGSPGCCQLGTTCCSNGAATCTPAAPIGSCPPTDAAAGTCTFTLGSNLQGTANASIASQQDTAIWGLTFASPTNGLSGTVLTKGVVPYNGQITAVMIKGIAMPNTAAGAPPPLNQIHIQDLRPQPNGTLLVINTSQPFNLPDSGDPQQVTTFMPTNLCVQAGDVVAFNDEGGYDPTWYPNGVSFQIFSSASGPRYAFFTQHQGTGNGAAFPLSGMPAPITYSTPNGSPVYNQELLMQYTLATGPAATPLCAGGTMGQTATSG